MRHYVLSVLAALTLNSIHGQTDCDDFATVTASYTATHSSMISLGGDYFTELGITAGIHATHTFGATKVVKQGENEYIVSGRQVGVSAQLGYRIFRIDYVLSVMGYAGYSMGSDQAFGLFTSIRILKPMNNWAISVEPMYHQNGKLPIRFSVHRRL